MLMEDMPKYNGVVNDHMTKLLKSSFLCELLDDDSNLLLLQNNDNIMTLTVQLNMWSVILKNTHSECSGKDT